MPRERCRGNIFMSKVCFVWALVLAAPLGDLDADELHREHHQAHRHDFHRSRTLGRIPDLETEDGIVLRNRRYAFVMMAYDPPGKPPNTLWGVLPMAHVIQEFSDYPLVLLTNTTHWPDGTNVASSLAKLGVQVLPVRPVPVPDRILHEHRHMPCEENGSPEICGYQFFKLQIWRLTQFDKLIWMDNDGILVRSADYLFQRRGTWGQQDNWDCGSWLSLVARNSVFFTRLVDKLQRSIPSSAPMEQATGVCSGMLLLKPSEDTYQGLIRHLASMETVPGGDQQVVDTYFKKVKNPVKLLEVETATFGQCVGKAIPGGKLPTFVHKSDWLNSCFHLGAAAEDCVTHPLGRYWHENFCSAISIAGIGGDRLEEFCSPAQATLWQWHRELMEAPGMRRESGSTRSLWWLLAGSALSCTMVSVVAAATGKAGGCKSSW